MASSFSIGTFNIRGLNEQTKKAELCRDFERYGVDIGCLQETKVKKGCSEVVNGFDIDCFPTTVDSYGLGFAVNSIWKDTVSTQKMEGK